MIKSFSSYLTEATKEVVFTFGRFNPPTNGHEKLLNKVASIAKGNNYRIYASQSVDAKKNPLDFTTKIKYMRKMFTKHGREIMADKDVKNVFDILVKLYDQGFTKVTMVVGSDRVSEFEALTNKYNGKEGRHGMYNFEGGIQIVSAGERDPDADDVSGMSASKMRKAAADNDYSSFSKGLPSGFKDGQELFNTLRKAMGLKESIEFRNHIQLEKVSDTREAYVNGSLFVVGEEVIIKETNEVGKITFLGANYVLVETPTGKHRKWLESVEKIEEKKMNVKQWKKDVSTFHKEPVDVDVDSDIDSLDNLDYAVPDELDGTDSKATKKMINKFDKERLHTRKGVAYEEKDDPCWKDYEMIGMKKNKDGKSVPNCVPKKKNFKEFLGNIK